MARCPIFQNQRKWKVISKAVYTVLGVNKNGIKDALGMYISETEGAHFWLNIMTDLSNRSRKIF